MVSDRFLDNLTTVEQVRNKLREIPVIATRTEKHTLANLHGQAVLNKLYESVETSEMDELTDNTLRSLDIRILEGQFDKMLDFPPESLDEYPGMLFCPMAKARFSAIGEGGKPISEQHEVSYAEAAYDSRSCLKLNAKGQSAAVAYQRIRAVSQTLFISTFDIPQKGLIDHYNARVAATAWDCIEEATYKSSLRGTTYKFNRLCNNYEWDLFDSYNILAQPFVFAQGFHSKPFVKLHLLRSEILLGLHMLRSTLEHLHREGKATLLLLSWYGRRARFFQFHYNGENVIIHRGEFMDLGDMKRRVIDRMLRWMLCEPRDYLDYRKGEVTFREA